jgi:hypothetical protein
VSPKAAKDRRPVLVADGRIGHLIYWPPPVAEARNLLPEGVARRRGRGRTRARVMFDDGRTLTIPTARLTILEPPHGT